MYHKYRLHRLNESTNDNAHRVLIDSASACFSAGTRPTMNVLNSLTYQISGTIHEHINESVIYVLCTAIVYLCSDSSPCIKAFIDAGVKTRLMHLLTHHSEVVVTSALRAHRTLVLANAASSSLNTLPTNDTIVVGSPARRRQVTIQDQVSYIQPNAEMNEKKESSSNWLISPLTNPMYGQAFSNLCEMDLITCQNVEMFKATNDDFDNHEGEAGAAIIGQVGIRCIHCGLSPFARAEFSTVYPGTVGLMAASLRHMTEKHIPSCVRVPLNVRRRIYPLLTQGTQESDDNSLKSFCVDICKRTGVINRYPQRSGLVTLEITKVAPKERVVHLTQRNSYDEKTLYHPLACVSSNLFDSIGNDDDCTNGTKAPLPLQMKVRNSPKMTKLQEINRDSASNTLQSAADESTHQTPSYVKDRNGLWRCRRCVGDHLQREIAFSTWEGLDAPPLWFAKKHYQFCAQPSSDSSTTTTTQYSKESSQYLGHSSECNRRKPDQYIEPQQSDSGKSNHPNDQSVVHHEGNGESNQEADATKDAPPLWFAKKHYQFCAQPSSDSSTTTTTQYSKETSRYVGHNSECNGRKPNQYIEPQQSDSGKSNHPNDRSVVQHEGHSGSNQEAGAKNDACTIKTRPHENQESKVTSKYAEILLPEDKFMISDFTFEVMSNLKRCFYSNYIDGKLRSKTKFHNGYPGLQCIHCANDKKARKFFFSQSTQLLHALNRVNDHLMKCKFCPTSVKEKLQSLKVTHAEQTRQKVGRCSVFFDVCWTRLHGGLPPPLQSSNRMILAHHSEKPWLSNYENTVRQNVEVFCVQTEDDVAFWNTFAPNLTIRQGQVGLRCLNCAKLGQDKNELNSTFFPSNLEDIVPCVQQLQEKHFPHCRYISSDLRFELTKLNLKVLCTNKTKKLWIDLAKMLGMYTSDHGVAFIKRTIEETSSASSPQASPTKSPNFTTSIFDELPHPDLNMNTFMPFPMQQGTLDALASQTIPLANLEMYNESDRVKTVHFTNPWEMQHQQQNPNMPFPQLPPVNTVTPCATGEKRKHSSISLATCNGWDNQDPMSPKKQMSL